MSCQATPLRSSPSTEAPTEAPIEATTEAPIECASLFVFSTYPDNPVTRLQLDAWQAGSVKGERRSREPVHDALAALHKVNAPDEATLDDLRGMAEFATSRSAPAERRLGQSRVVIVQVAPGTLDESICERIVGGLTGAAIERRPLAIVKLAGSRLCETEDGTLVWICERSRAAACVRFLLGPFRLFETHRHKVLGQFAEYESAFRQPALAAAEVLKRALERLDGTWRDVAGEQTRHARPTELPSHTGPGSRAHEAAVAASHEVTQAYKQALLARAPVRQIDAMLTANLRNLHRIRQTMPRAWRTTVTARRAEPLGMLRSQVRSDERFVEPLLKAAESATQAFHAQMLADLADAEATENRWRAVESAAKERQNERLVLVGLWLGLNQTCAGCLSLSGKTNTWSSLELCAALSVPSVVAGLAWLIAVVHSMVQRPSRRAPP